MSKQNLVKPKRCDCGVDIYFLPGVNKKGEPRRYPVIASELTELEIETIRGGGQVSFIKDKHTNHFLKCPYANKYRRKIG